MLCGGLAAMTWALVNFQNSNFDSPQCDARLEDLGFAGNADFYGLGIRLGMYLQWLAQLLANVFLRGEWANLFGANMVFAFALTVAVLILTLRRECTFTAEIIVIIFMFWGHFLSCLVASPGYTLSFHWSVYTRDLPILHKIFPWPPRPAPDCRRAVVNEMRNWSRASRHFGSILAITAPAIFMELFSLWFWIRLGTVGENDFAPRPGGTQYFLIFPMPAENKGATRFFIVMCIGYFAILFLTPLSFAHVWLSRKMRARSEAGDTTAPEVRAPSSYSSGNARAQGRWTLPQV